MPIGAALGALGSVLGGISGAANTRPPSLNPAQSKALNTILPFLTQGAMGPLSINPQEQALNYGNIAQSLTGANNAVTHSLVSRGLGRSGILGSALMQNQLGATQAQNSSNMGLLQQSFQQRLADLQALMQGLNVNATPGQSGFGGFMAGMAPVAAYSIQNALNNMNPVAAGINSLPLGTMPTFPQLAPQG